MRRLLIATTNAGKLREIRELLADVPVELLSLSDLAAPATDHRTPTTDHRPSVLPAPDETGATFIENARLKALYYARGTGQLTVAEDSGLAIDGLGGEPGVHSARFLRPDASYAERFAEIERRLAGRPEADRAARFVCALALADGESIRFETERIVEGRIAPEPRGAGGFGYDPVFFYPAYGRILAQVSQAEKLAVAHRGQAFRAFATWLRSSSLLA